MRGGCRRIGENRIVPQEVALPTHHLILLLRVHVVVQAYYPVAFGVQHSLPAALMTSCFAVIHHLILDKLKMPAQRQRWNAPLCKCNRVGSPFDQYYIFCWRTINTFDTGPALTHKVAPRVGMLFAFNRARLRYLSRPPRATGFVCAFGPLPDRGGGTY